MCGDGQRHARRLGMAPPVMKVGLGAWLVNVFTCSQLAAAFEQTVKFEPLHAVTGCYSAISIARKYFFTVRLGLFLVFDPV